MRKNSLKSIVSPLLILVSVFCSVALAEQTTLSPQPIVDPNSYLSFKKIFIGEIKDNVGGTFKEVILTAFKDVFKKNLRFQLVLDSADAVLETNVEKSTTTIHIELTLKVGPALEVFSKDEVSVPASATEVEIREALKQLLNSAIHRIPFYGTVTGRDGNQLTFDIGTNQGVHVGDTLKIARIDQIHRHPKLQSILHVQLIPVGLATVDQVEDSIAFGRVEEEFAGSKIEKLYKVIAIESLPKPEQSERAEAKDSQQKSFSKRPYELGFLQLAGFVGFISSQTSKASTSANFSGSALSPGARASGEMWLTKNFFANAMYGIHLFSFTHEGKGGSSGQKATTSASGTTANLSMNAGYRHFLSDNLEGPLACFELGYYHFKFSPNIDSNTLLGPKTYAGLNVGLSGQLPISASLYGLLVKINFLLFPSFSEAGVETGPTTNTEVNVSTTGIAFYLGGYYHLNERMALRAGVQFETFSTEFSNPSAATTNQKQVGFLPAILYYF